MQQSQFVVLEKEIAPLLNQENVECYLQFDVCKFLRHANESSHLQRYIDKFQVQSCMYPFEYGHQESIGCRV